MSTVVTARLRASTCAPAIHATPVSTGIRWVQHFPFLGLLPPPTADWRGIPGLYVARCGVPPVGAVIFIRTCRRIGGSTDVPKVTSDRVPAPTP